METTTISEAIAAHKATYSSAVDAAAATINLPTGWTARYIVTVGLISGTLDPIIEAEFTGPTMSEWQTSRCAPTAKQRRTVDAVKAAMPLPVRMYGYRATGPV